jgi:hypothetical protein
MVERKKERNLRTSDNMRTLFFLGSVAAIVCGARHFLNYLNEQRKNRLAQKRLEVWEGEGGAVPAGRRRTAQQVSPRKVSGASLRGVSR